jgi:hypothetical protein
MLQKSALLKKKSPVRGGPAGGARHLGLWGELPSNASIPLEHLCTHARHISPHRDGHRAGRSWHVDFYEEAEAMAGGKVFAKKMSWNMKSSVMLAFSERSGRDLIGNTGPGTSTPLHIVLTNGYKKLDSTELDGT